MEEKAYFAMGCFWHVQAVFDKVEGVLKTTVGYTDGKGDANYENIKDKGHAEAIEVVFDPDKVSFKKLLDTFWSEHDPTTRDSQGPDFGKQYRSGIYYTSEEQKRIAEESLKSYQSVVENKIVTEIKPFENFDVGEEYHQKYLEKHGKVCN